MPDPIGGLRFFRIDDLTLDVVDGGDVSMTFSVPTTETIMALTGPAGFAEKPNPGECEAEVVIDPVTFQTLLAKRAATVTACNAAGQSGSGSGMWYAGESVYNMHKGTATVKFSGKNFLPIGA
jgi:hypothetical protein